MTPENHAEIHQETFFLKLTLLKMHMTEMQEQYACMSGFARLDIQS